MDELKSLSEQILNRINEEGKQSIVDTESRLARMMEENRQRLVQQGKNRKQAIAAAVQNDFERQQQTLRNNERNALLKEKQALLTEILDEAVEHMTQWNESQFFVFLQQILKQFPANQKYIIVPGEKSKNYFTPQKMADLQKSYPNVTVADAPTAKKAGFSIQNGGIVYNYYSDELVADLKSDLSPKLASLAFQDDQ